MILKYGTYPHELSTVGLAISKSEVPGPGGEPFMINERWQIDGWLPVAHGAPQSAITAAIDALVQAYSVNGRDLVLYLPDGTTPTSHRLLSAQTVGGTRVTTKPSFPTGTGIEYVTLRTFSIVVEAEYFDVNAAGLLAWDESLTFSGGGPRHVWRQPINGLPVKQQVADATTFVVVQQGHAVGAVSYPSGSSPIWPAHEHRDRRQTFRRAPRRTGPIGKRVYVEYEAGWTYHFEAAGPLISNPRAAPP